MSTPAKFRFFLKASANTYYYTDAAGIVQTIANPSVPTDYALKSEPYNWADIEIKWGRSDTYFGVFRAVSSSMRFIDDGADICRKVYFSQGVEGHLEVVIEIRNDTTWLYDVLYKGTVDFFGSVDELTAFTASIAESGLVAMLKANENTPYELPLTNANGAFDVYVDGPTLEADYVYSTFSTVQTGVIANQYFPVPFVGVSKDGDYSIGTQQDQTSMLMGNGAPAWTNGSSQHNNYAYLVDPNYPASVSVKLKVQHDINYAADGANGSPIALELYAVIGDAVGNIVSSTRIYVDPNTPLNAGQSRTIPLNFTTSALTMAPTQRLYCLYRLVPITPISGTPKADFAFFSPAATTQRVDILIDFRLPGTNTKSLRYYQVLDKLVSKMSDGANTAHSSFLSDHNVVTGAGTTNVVDSKPYQVAVTSGDALRRLTTNTAYQPADPALRITFRNYFQDAFGRWLLGVGLDANNNLIMEHLSHFFDNATLIADLGDVANLKVEPLKEYMFTQFKTGFPKADLNKLNGKDAFNTTSVWKLPMQAIPFREEDFTSSLQGDMYVTEYTRANLGDKKTTDSENDNSSFLLDIDTTQTSGAYNMRRLNNTLNTSGIISPNYAYNLSLSPARATWRMGPYLRSIAHLLDAKSISFQTSDRNQYLLSNLGWGAISENANILVGNLDSILFKPVKFTFDAEPPLNLGDLMNSSPYGYFTAQWYGKPIKGFVADVSMKPGRSAIQQWTLIATPDCDLTQFYPQ